jgi:hypothetical protein
METGSIITACATNVLVIIYKATSSLLGQAAIEPHFGAGIFLL